MPNDTWKIFIPSISWVLQLYGQDYLKLATAGAACNAIVRLVLHPLDCVKTTVQAEMGRSDGDDVLGEGQQERDGGWVGIVRRILNKGGVVELLRGIDVSTVSRTVTTAIMLAQYAARNVIEGHSEVVNDCGSLEEHAFMDCSRHLSVDSVNPLLVTSISVDLEF